MILEKDFRNDCYVIRITREEMKRMFIKANDNARTLGYTEDEFVAEEFSRKILGIINSDMRGD